MALTTEDTTAIQNARAMIAVIDSKMETVIKKAETDSTTLRDQLAVIETTKNTRLAELTAKRTAQKDIIDVIAKNAVL